MNLLKGEQQLNKARKNKENNTASSHSTISERKRHTLFFFFHIYKAKISKHFSNEQEKSLQKVEREVASSSPAT